MTSKIAFEGGPAFPTEAWMDSELDENGKREYFPASHPGMSLRDYYAGKALLALLTNPHYNSWSWSDMAKEAFSIADKMVQVRATE